MIARSRTRCPCCPAKVRQVVAAPDTSHLRPPCTQLLNNNRISLSVSLRFIDARCNGINRVDTGNDFDFFLLSLPRVLSELNECYRIALGLTMIWTESSRLFEIQMRLAERRRRRYAWRWRRCVRRACRSSSSRHSPWTAAVRVSW
jgi:hypothetical protein